MTQTPAAFTVRTPQGTNIYGGNAGVFHAVFVAVYFSPFAGGAIGV